MTFSGIGGQGKWAYNPVEEVLPVELVPYDDRREHCEGVYPVVTAPGHEVLEGIDEEFPFVLGYNYSKAKKDAEAVSYTHLTELFGSLLPNPGIFVGVCFKLGTIDVDMLDVYKRQYFF